MWLSKDGELVILHGKGIGNLSEYDGYKRSDKIWRKTKDELLEVDIGDGTAPPTLREFLELFQDAP